MNIYIIRYRIKVRLQQFRNRLHYAGIWKKKEIVRNAATLARLRDDTLEWDD